MTTECISFFLEFVFYEKHGRDDMLFIFNDFTDKPLSKPQLGTFGSLGLESLLSLVFTELRSIRLRSIIPPPLSPKTTFPVSILQQNGSYSLHKPHKMDTSYPFSVPSFQHPLDKSSWIYTIPSYIVLSPMLLFPSQGSLVLL